MRELNEVEVNEVSGGCIPGLGATIVNGFVSMGFSVATVVVTNWVKNYFNGNRAYQ